MVSVKLQERLADVEQMVASRVDTTEPDYWLCYCHWPEPQQARFHALWNSRQEGLTEAEAEELYAGISKCRIAQLDQESHYEDLENETEDEHAAEQDDDREDRHPYDYHHDDQISATDEGQEEYEAENEYADECPENEPVIRSEWDPNALSLVLAFHRYAATHPSITCPEHRDLLKQYFLDTLRRLFEKYGWISGQPDCTTISPLDQWVAADRNRLEHLYGTWC